MDVLNQFLGRIIVQIIDPIILLLSAGAFVIFLWGIFEFIRPANAAKREEGRSAIFWGLIGLVIIFGAYGIINVALGTFDLGTIQDKLPQ